MRNVLSYIFFAFALTLQAEEIMEIRYISSADNTDQPAMFYKPDTKSAVPLVVALHTWSGDYKQQMYRAIEAWCVANQWAYIHPNFRGPNRRPQATGSELVIKDIVSAVEYAKKNANIDTAAIYITGASGGGYTALMMAGKHPEIWAGVSAWVPISDLKAWHQQGRYVRDMEQSCGGAPGDSEAVDAEYTKRSPLTWLSQAKEVDIHINAGIHDGHTGSVPISHSLLAFNVLASAEERLSQEEIDFFVDQEDVPPALKREVSDPSYGQKKVLFRRTSGHVTVTIFEGGHEIIQKAAIDWMHQDFQNSSPL